MERRTVAIVVGVVVLVVAAAVGGVLLVSQQFYRQSYTSDYEYQVRISPSERITNATFYLPLPVADGESAVGEAVEEREYLKPDTWQYDTVDTEYGPMLRVRADEVPTGPSYYRAVFEDDRLVRWEPISAAEYDPESNDLRIANDAVELDASVHSDDTIDTKTPGDDEPLLAPTSNVTRVPCPDVGRPSETQECARFDTRVYADYDADPDATVYVSVEFRGANSWWVFGWNYNEYSERAYAELTGAGDGWTAVNGTMETGVGNY